jgi:uncharacterized glyoxalase superfamily protein PhnB
MAKKAKKATKTAAKRTIKKAVKRPMKKAAAKKPLAKKAPAKQVAAKRTASRAGGTALMSLSPGFTANDAAATIKWYCDVLGFNVIERWEHEGQFLGAEIGSGNVKINVGQDDWKMGRDRIKGQGTRIYITTGPDIDAYAAGVKARGGALAEDLQDGWGMRAFSINDPDGFKITFYTMLKA